MPARGSYGGYWGGASSSGYGRTRREEELAKATGTDAYDQSGLGSYVNLADMDANEAVTAAEDLAIEENIIDTIDERSDQELQQLAQEGLITEDRVLQLIEENQLSQEEIDEGMEPPYTQEDVDVWFEGVSDQFMSREEIETAIADGSLTEEDVQRLIDDGLLTEEDVQQLIADEVLSEEQIQDLIDDGQFSQEQIDGWIADAVEGFLSEEEIDQLIADGTLTEEEISRLIEEGQFTEEQIQQLIQQEMLSEEDIQKLIDTGQFSEEEIDGWIADAVEGFLSEEEINQLIADGTLSEEEISKLIDEGQFTEEQIQQLIAQEMLSEEAIQKLIAQEMLSEEAIQQLIQQEMLSEEDIQKLIDTGQFSQEQIDGWIADAVEGLLTEEEIDQLIADGTLTEEEINQLIADGQLTQEQIRELILTEQLSDEHINSLIEAGAISQEQLDSILQEFENTTLSDYVTLEALEERLGQTLTPEQLEAYGYLTAEDVAGLGYLTADDTAGFLTREEYESGLPNTEGYDQRFEELTAQLAALEEQLANAQTQYDADAARHQRDQTREELDEYFAAAQPSGPRTGTTSEFQPIDGSSPMSSLIASQQGPGGLNTEPDITTYTPGYSDWEAPMSIDKMGEYRGPGPVFEYANPLWDPMNPESEFIDGSYDDGTLITGTFNQGGQVRQPQQSTMFNQNSILDQRPGQTNQGILGALNFQTNVAPFQNAFRPNVTRNN